MTTVTLPKPTLVWRERSPVPPPSEEGYINDYSTRRTGADASSLIKYAMLMSLCTCVLVFTLETAYSNQQRNMPAVLKRGNSRDASCSARIQRSFSWKPPRNMTLFIYDHHRLRGVVASVLGTSALQWYDGIYLSLIHI